MFFYSLIKKIKIFWYKQSPIVPNRIVFDNFLGRGYGDSPKAIAEELLKTQEKWDIVWLVNSPNYVFPKGIRTVNRGTIDEIKEVYTAKFRIINTKNGCNYIKKRGQICIQTNHGDFYPKYVEGECEEHLSVKYVNESKADSARTDIVVSGSSWQTIQLKKFFWYPDNIEILECGVPRNDIFFNISEEKRANIKSKYFSDDSVKILLYAPTFRDDGSIDAYSLDINRITDTLETLYAEKWAAIIRLHPNDVRHSHLFCFNERIVDGSSCADPQELTIICDLLITDYSSIMMDAAIQNKPVLLFAPDINHYVKYCRELRPLYYKLPFIRSLTNNEICEALKNIKNESYIKKTEEFINEQYVSYDKGEASKVVVQRIIDLLKL